MSLPHACRRLPLKASAAFPENTLASFRHAIQDGADGLESGAHSLFEVYARKSAHFNSACIADVHVSRDGVLIMFHDPRLDRTTDTTGLIRDKNWHGDLEHARAAGHPIPTFAQTLALLMEVSRRVHSSSVLLY